MIHVLDPHIYRPYFTSIAILKAVMETHKGSFEWKKPPYEYNYKKKPIDLIIGDLSLRHELESGVSLSVIKKKWEADTEYFVNWRKPYLLYS